MDSWWEMGLWIPWVWWEAGGELGSLNGSIQGLDGLGETWDSRIVPARGRAWHWMDFSKPSLLGFSELDTTGLGIEALEMCRRCGGPALQTGVYNGKHGKVRSHCSERERRRLWPFPPCPGHGEGHGNLLGTGWIQCWMPWSSGRDRNCFVPSRISRDVSWIQNQSGISDPESVRTAVTSKPQ